MGSSALVASSGAVRAACINTGGTNWVCSGAETAAQDINQNSATVTTTPGFGVNTSDSVALHIHGDGALSYQDNNASPLTGASGGLLIEAGSNGAVTVNTAGTIAGGVFGISAENPGTGATSVTASGTVKGDNVYGIAAINGAATFGSDGELIWANTPSGATALTVRAANVSGVAAGVVAWNGGAGNTAVNTSGSVTGGWASMSTTAWRPMT